MSYASDPAYLNLLEKSRAYRAQPNVKAATNAARVRDEGFKKNFFNRSGRYPTTNELIDMSVEAEMAKLVGIREEPNPNVAAVLSTQDVQGHNYNANIARWKAGVASGRINAAPRNFKATRKAQNNARLQEVNKVLKASNQQQILDRALAGQGTGVYVPPSVESYWNQFLSPENKKQRANNAAARAKKLAAIRGNHGPAHTRKNRKSRKNRR